MIHTPAQQVSVSFESKDKAIKVEINQENDGIHIKYTHKNKTLLIQCVTDPSYKQDTSDYATVINIGQKNIDEKFQGAMAWITEMIKDCDYLPDSKKKLLQTLTTTFPLFNEYKEINIEESLIQVNQHEQTRKEIYDSLIQKADTFDMLDQSMYIFSSKLRAITNIKKELTKEITIKEVVEENNISIEELIESCKKYTSWQKKIAQFKKDIQSLRGKDEATTRTKYNIGLTIHEYKKIIGDEEEYILPIYNKIMHSLDKTIKFSLQEFINLFSSKSIHTKYEKTLGDQEIKDKYDQAEYKKSLISHEISVEASNFYKESKKFIALDQPLVENGITYLQQQTSRKKEKRNSLSDQEKKVERIWNAFKELYISYRTTAVQLKESIDKTLFLDNIMDPLIRNNTLENKLFELQKNHDLKLIPAYNDALLTEDEEEIEHTQNILNSSQKTIDSLRQYKSLLEELEFQYRIFCNAEGKKLVEKNKKYHSESLRTINNLPNAIKDKGMRKFDSKYYDFFEWLKKKNHHLDKTTPLAYIEQAQKSGNKEDLQKIIDLLEPK